MATWTEGGLGTVPREGRPMNQSDHPSIHPCNGEGHSSTSQTRNIGIMYCVMFCLRLSGIEKATFAPLFLEVLELCIVLCFSSAICIGNDHIWMTSIHTRSIGIMYCIMFWLYHPTLPDNQVLTRDPPPPIDKYWNYVLYYIFYHSSTSKTFAHPGILDNTTIYWVVGITY